MNRFLPAVLIILLLIVFRIIGSAYPEALPNFQPLAALFFCGAIMAKGWKGWAIPLGAWLVSYPAPAFLDGNTGYLSPVILLTTALGFAVTFLIGKSLSEKGFGLLLVGSVAAALAFHLVTNSIAWIGDPVYAKNLGGLWQSLWTGSAVSSIPTWVFLRNMTAANLIFSAVFLSARFALPKFSQNAEPLTAR